MIRFLLALWRAILSGGFTREEPLAPETSQRIDPRRLERGAYGVSGKPVRMGVRRADGTLRSQDGETTEEQRWRSEAP